MSTNQEEQSKQEKQQTALEKKTQAKNNREMIMTVATGGICLAMSYALSLVKLFELPQGGTITPASMLPIIFFCLIFGAKKGFCVTFIYSLLQLIGGHDVGQRDVVVDLVTVARHVFGRHLVGEELGHGVGRDGETGIILCPFRIRMDQDIDLFSEVST